MKRILLAVLLLGSVTASYGTVYHYVRNTSTDESWRERVEVVFSYEYIYVYMENSSVTINIRAVEHNNYCVIYRGVDKQGRIHMIKKENNGRLFWKFGNKMVELISL